MKDYSEYYQLLRHELIPAYGCTEPSALAYATAIAVSTLGSFPKKIEAFCSSSIIKNVFSVDIPNAADLKGPKAAIILGALIAKPELKLCILQSVSTEQLKKAKDLYKENFCNVRLQPEYENLYIRIFVENGEHSSEVELIHEHTNISFIKRDGIVIRQNYIAMESAPDKSFLSVQNIIDFADNCDISLIAETLDQQIHDNSAIAKEGLSNNYGVCVGKNLMSFYDASDVRIRARAKAAAASDARMAGCVMPVVINSGSGNQGLTVSLPVIEYAKENSVSHDRLLRALIVSNLIAILQKRTIGNLSAFCGAVHAAAGAACGISYLSGGTYENISDIITYTLGTIGGMLCDGAKASCAAKISEALDAALMGMQLSLRKKCLNDGEGLVQADVESTIDNFGKVGKDGMKTTNEVVLQLMLKKRD